MTPANSTSWSPPIPPLNLAPWNLPDLAAASAKKIDQRESRIKELELELTAWKQAHANLLESVERERKAHNVQIASFNRHFASLDFFKVRASDLGAILFSELTGISLEPKPPYPLYY